MTTPLTGETIAETGTEMTGRMTATTGQTTMKVTTTVPTQLMTMTGTVEMTRTVMMTYLNPERTLRTIPPPTETVEKPVKTGPVRGVTVATSQMKRTRTAH